MRRGGVGPRILEDLEAGTVLGDGGQDVEQVARDLARRSRRVAANWLGAPTRTAIALRPKASQLYRFAPEITMPKVNLSRMTHKSHELPPLRKFCETAALR